MAASTVDVHVCRMRVLLAPHGIRLETVWGVGWRVAAADRRVIMDTLTASARAPPNAPQSLAAL
jgi:hypothetical protein